MTRVKFIKRLQRAVLFFLKNMLSCIYNKLCVMSYALCEKYANDVVKIIKLCSSKP